MTVIFSIISGLILLYFGAEALIKGSSAIAIRLGINPLIIGLTIVAFGTSAPELVVSLQAALAGTGDLSLGNVIGSNICNIGLILGLSALIRSLRIQLQIIRIDLPLMIGASLIFLCFFLNSRLNRLEGVVLFFGFIIFVLFNVRSISREKQRESMKDSKSCSVKLSGRIWKDLLLIGVGLLLLTTGADFLIKGSIAAASWLGISEAFVGLTIVALGTSLPELATSVLASWKGQNDIAVGNIIGSNILGVLGLTALIHPLQAYQIRVLDLLFMLGLSILILPLMRTGFTLKRWEGALMVGIYFFHIILIIMI
jgi:cation:H+ antiporter